MTRWPDRLTFRINLGKYGLRPDEIAEKQKEKTKLKTEKKGNAEENLKKMFKL